MKIENYVITVLDYLLNYLQKNGIDTSDLQDRKNTIQIKTSNTITDYAQYDKDKNELTYNPTINNGKRNVLGHECFHIAGGFENITGFDEFVTQYLNVLLLGNKKGYFSVFDYAIIDDLVGLLGFTNVVECYFTRNTKRMIDLIIEVLGDARGNFDGFDFLSTCDELFILNRSPFHSKKLLIEKEEKCKTILHNAHKENCTKKK